MNRFQYITILPDQSIMDIALMYYGSMEAIGWMLEDNPGILQMEDPEGTNVIIRPSTSDSSVVDYFKNQVIVTN